MISQARLSISVYLINLSQFIDYHVYYIGNSLGNSETKSMPLTRSFHFFLWLLWVCVTLSTSLSSLSSSSTFLEHFCWNRLFTFYGIDGSFILISNHKYDDLAQQPHILLPYHRNFRTIGILYIEFHSHVHVWFCKRPLVCDVLNYHFLGWK